MRFFILALMISIGLMSSSQSAYFYNPNWQHLYVFNNDVLQKTEFLPVQNLQVGNDYVAYIRNNNNLQFIRMVNL